MPSSKSFAFSVNIMHSILLSSNIIFKHSTAMNSVLCSKFCLKNILDLALTCLLYTIKFWKKITHFMTLRDNKGDIQEKLYVPFVIQLLENKKNAIPLLEKKTFTKHFLNHVRKWIQTHTHTFYFLPEKTGTSPARQQQEPDCWTSVSSLRCPFSHGPLPLPQLC